MTAHVWIVEYREGKKWQTCIDFHYTKRQAKAAMRDSESCFPDVRYRVRKYVRASK